MKIAWILFFFRPPLFILYTFDEWAKKLDDDIEKCVSSHTERKWNHVKSAVARSPKYRLTQSRKKNRIWWKKIFVTRINYAQRAAVVAMQTWWSCFPWNKSNRWQVFFCFWESKRVKNQVYIEKGNWMLWRNLLQWNYSSLRNYSRWLKRGVKSNENWLTWLWLTWLLRVLSVKLCWKLMLRLDVQRFVKLVSALLWFGFTSFGTNFSPLTQKLSFDIAAQLP